ncbi:hypothetical protein ACHAPB_000286 [Verticillium nonalfalfae]
MPANQRQPAAQPPPSPNAKATARYTNKDGSKIITVPKSAQSTDASQPSTPTTTTKAPVLPATNGTSPVDQEPAPAVNRKKQKRRAKLAAKAAAEQAAAATNTTSEPVPPTTPSAAPKPSPSTRQDEVEPEATDEEEDREGDNHANTNGTTSGKSKKSRKKKKKNGVAQAAADDPQSANVPPPATESHPLPPRGPGISKEKIWNTSSQEERERIKEFWLGLGEEDRKSLVKVEKDAVLRKMKEQQKHTCSCTVCGRKRTAIEEELEGLYDAYYEELEQFANQADGPPLPRDFPIRGRIASAYARQPPSRGRIVEHVGDDEDDEELDYSGEEDDEEEDEEDVDEDDDYSEDEPPEDVHPHDRDMADFLTFGNSLQVKGMQLLDSLLCSYGNMDLGGILTVADDLLKNDGKRFIEMMEQLAERRMAREEDARDARAFGHPAANGTYGGHTHPPPEDEYDDEDEDDDEYDDDSQDEGYDDEEDTMTEEQRMEEGRRMFQIFAARMFEQRVLTAYRNMVAQQRQNKLLEELDEEQRQDAQRKAKKAKDAQRRKDKAALKKQALAEDKARREAAKAAEEAARLEEQQRRAEEQRQKAEEKRRKKDEQKRLEEEDRQRKEAERQRRAQEQMDKRAEQDRKVREAKEKEKRLKDEARLRDKEVKEQREREHREKKERLEQGKLDREAKARTDREAKAKVDKDIQDRRKQDEKATQKTAALAAAAAAAAAAPTPVQAPARRASHNLVPVPAALPQHPPNQASFASPKIAVATPALPKAPTPIRPKNAPQSQDVSTGSSVIGSQASQAGSAPSQNPSPHSATPAHPSPHPFIAQRKGSGVPPLQPQSVSPPHAKGPNAGPFGMPPGISHPPGFPTPPPGLAHRPPPHDPMFAQFGGFRPPPGMGMPGPPGLNGMNGPPGRGFPMPHPPPGFSQPFGEPMPPNGPPHVSHTRQSSGGFESGPSMASQPIGRPAPIGRPGSVVHGQGLDQVDDVSDQHLGSSALLDDSEEPIRAATTRQLHQAPGPGPRQAFPSTPFGMDAGMHLQSNPWSNPSPFAAFGPPPGLGGPTWGNPLAAIPPMPSLANLRTGGNPRSVAVRRMLCRVCKELQGRGVDGTDGFADLNIIMSEVEQLNRMEGVSREVISESEILDLAETEGTPHNGGGVFDIRKDVRGPGKHAVRWMPDLVGDMAQPPRAVGEIGSPVIGTGHPAFPMRGS